MLASVLGTKAQCPDSVQCNSPDQFIITVTPIPNSGNVDSIEIRVNTTNHGVTVDSIVGNNIYITSSSLSCTDTSNRIKYFYNGSNVAQCNDDTPLPVELLSYNAHLGDSHIIITWTTASELNNKGFYILKYNGIQFESIGFVNGVGNSSSLNTYHFEDPNILDGYNYYQLYQTDYDGTLDSSNIFYLKISKLKDNEDVIITDFDILGKKSRYNRILIK